MDQKANCSQIKILLMFSQKQTFRKVKGTMLHLEKSSLRSWPLKRNKAVVQKLKIDHLIDLHLFPLPFLTVFSYICLLAGQRLFAGLYHIALKENGKTSAAARAEILLKEFLGPALSVAVWPRAACRVRNNDAIPCDW